jgi:hypothetical protein
MRKNEIINMLIISMPYPERKEFYEKIRDPFKFPKHMVGWVYYPGLTDDGLLPEYDFARIAPRAIIVNSRLKQAHENAKREQKESMLNLAGRGVMEAESRARVFSTKRLIKKLVTDDRLVKILGETEGETVLCNSEIWYYQKATASYAICSSAILAANVPEIMSTMPIKEWEDITKRYWIRMRGNAKIDGMIHEPREEIHPDVFYTIADQHKIT